MRDHEGAYLIAFFLAALALLEAAAGCGFSVIIIPIVLSFVFVGIGLFVETLDDRKR